MTREEDKEAALAAGADAISWEMPRHPEEGWWPRAEALRREAAKRGLKFYLQWDRLLAEGELAEAGNSLAAAAGLAPDALVIRDMGLFREARRRYPDLGLHAAPSWGCHNS